MLVYVNGKIVPLEEATVPAADHGFLYGIGLFETVRVYNNRLFLWKEHFARLSAGLFALQIRAVWTERELARAILQTAAANRLQDAYVRLSVTGGAEGVGLISGEYQHPSLYIFAKQVPPIAEPPAGKQLRTVSIPRQTVEGHQRFKSHNFLNNALAKMEAGSDPTVEGLFLTSDGYLCEGIVSNVFWISGNKLYTPSADAAILDGITRRHVLSLAEQSGIACEEGLYRKEHLLAADEVFVTNSIQEIVPVTHVDGAEIRHAYGPVTRQLRFAYRRSVELSGQLWYAIDNIQEGDKNGEA